MRFIAFALACLLALPATAVDRGRIATLNVGMTSIVTFIGCVVQGNVKSRRDAFRCLAAGTVAGIGFYQAKRLVARGDITRGWLVANTSTSIVENTTAGEHPFSRIGYTFGPLRLRVATPLDRERASYVDVDVSAVETGFLLRAIDDADDVDVRDGMIWYETDEPDRDEEGRAVHGFTWGVFPGVWRGAEERTWNHEAVHAVQSLQLDSVEPPALTLERERRPVRIRYVRAGALNLADNLVMAQTPYERRWAEIEAYRLVEDRRPPE